MNYFVLICGLLQIAGAIQYWSQGKFWFGVLYCLYGLTNFVIIMMGK